MTTITEYLAEQKRLAEAATPGPWDAECDDGEGTAEVNAGTARTEWTDHGNGISTGRRAGSWKTTDRIAERDDLYDEDFEQAEADAEFIAAARESLPRLVAALEAVVELHRFENGSNVFGYREERCRNCQGSWPCPTIRAIEAALGGESDGE